MLEVVEDEEASRERMGGRVGNITLAVGPDEVAEPLGEKSGKTGVNRRSQRRFTNSKLTTRSRAKVE